MTKAKRGTPATADEAMAVVRAWHTARRLVMAADTREKFLTGSADLWEAERDMEQWAIRDEIGRRP